MKEEQTGYEIYYDEIGDFLEVSFGEPPKTEYSREIEPGVFITYDEKTNEIKSVGILAFKKRAGLLAKVLAKMNLKMPLNISALRELQ